MRLEVHHKSGQRQRALTALHRRQVVLVHIAQVHVHHLLSLGYRLDNTALQRHLVRLVNGEVAAYLQCALIDEEVERVEECGELVALGQHLTLVAHLLHCQLKEIFIAEWQLQPRSVIDKQPACGEKHRHRSYYTALVTATARHARQSVLQFLAGLLHIWHKVRTEQRTQLLHLYKQIAQPLLLVSLQFLENALRLLVAREVVRRNLTQHHAVRQGVVVSLRSLLAKQNYRGVHLRCLDVVARCRAAFLLAVSVVRHSLKALELLVAYLLVVVFLENTRHISEPFEDREECSVRNLVKVRRWSRRHLIQSTDTLSYLRLA